MKRTNKLPMEQILVASGDQIVVTGDFSTNSTSLNLADGQLGILSWDINSAVRPLGEYLQAGDDSNDVAAIKIVQGTPNSSQTQLADPWEVGDPSHVESGIIRKNRVRSVMVKAAKFATLGAQAVTDFPTPVDDADYFAYLNLDSVRYSKEYGINNPNVIYARAPITNFTALAPTDDLDYVLQHIIADFNSQSKAVSTNTRKGNKSFVVFGVKAGGGSGQAIGTITPTTSITFQTVDGVNQVLKSSVELCQSLAQIVDAGGTIDGSSTIEVVDITTAGAAAKVDALIVVGLPHTLAAYYDNVPQKMVRPQISMGGAFIGAGVTDPTVVKVSAQEGTGHSRNWKLRSDLRNQPNIHTKQVQPKDDWFSEGKSYIDLAKEFYTSYIIEYYDTENTLTLEIGSPKKTTLLFRAEPNSSFTVTVANIATRLGASSTPIPFFTSNDAGTGTISANTVSDIEDILTVWLEHVRTTGENFLVGGDAVAGGTYLS